MVLLKRVGEELDQTEEDDITENKRLQAKLKRELCQEGQGQAQAQTDQDSRP